MSLRVAGLQSEILVKKYLKILTKDQPYKWMPKIPLQIFTWY